MTLSSPALAVIKTGGEKASRSYPMGTTARFHLVLPDARLIFVKRRGKSPELTLWDSVT